MDLDDDNDLHDHDKLKVVLATDQCSLTVTQPNQVPTAVEEV